jgi:hypothetical protein
MQHVENIQYGYLLNKYLKYRVWRLAVRYGQYSGPFGVKGFNRVFVEIRE